MAQLNESVGADVPIAGRGPGEDPGPLRQGQGDGRAQRDVGRVTGARGRAGHGERRGPEPPQRAARRARPRRRRRPAPAVEQQATAEQPRRPDALGRNDWSPRLSARAPQPGSSHEVVAVDDLVGHARREVAGVAPGDLAQLGGLDEHHAPGERDAVGADDVDGVALAEAPGDVDDAGRAAGSSGARRAPAGRRRRPSRSRRRARRRRSTACGPPACAGGPRSSCRPASSATAPPSTPGRAGVGDHRAHARPRGDAGRLQLAGHAAAPPPAAAAAGADRQHRVVDADPRDELGIGVRRGGRRCTGPSRSVSSTSTAAPTLWATRAARRSLSP